MLDSGLAGTPSSDDFFCEIGLRMVLNGRWRNLPFFFKPSLECPFKKGFDPKNIPIYLKLANFLMSMFPMVFKPISAENSPIKYGRK